MTADDVRAPRHPAYVALGWTIAVAFFAAVWLLEKWPGYAIMGVAICVGLISETITTTRRQRFWLKSAYLAIAGAGLLLMILAME